MTMKRAWQGVLLAGVLAGCNQDILIQDGFNESEARVIRQMADPTAAPAKDTTNKYADDARAAALGQKLFFDKAFSGPLVVGNDGTNGALGNAGDTGKVACVSCHQPENYMGDKRSNPNNTALGANWMIRNASTALNSSFYQVWCENDGVRDSQWSDGLTDPEDPTSMNGSRLKVAHVLYAKYRDEYNALYDTPLPAELDPANANAARFPSDGKPGDPAFDNLPAQDKDIINRIYANFGKATQAYIRKLANRNSPFDKYGAPEGQGDRNAISDSAKRGLKLYLGKAGCVQCHSGPIMSDSKFHNTGMQAKGEHIIPTETGRYDAINALLSIEFTSDGPYSDDRNTGRLAGLTATDADKGKWRSKQLRNVAETAPYMHTGQFATLRDVIDFYDRGGDPDGTYVGTKDPLMKKLNLTEQEKDDLVEFLKTLTGEKPSGSLFQDTSNP